MIDHELINQSIKYTCTSNNVDGLHNSIKCSITPHIYNTLACCNVYSSQIEISKTFWNRCTEKQKRNAIIHEVAHIISYRIHKEKNPSHNNLWKSIVKNSCGDTNEKICEEYLGKDTHPFGCLCSSIYLPQNKIDSLLSQKYYCEQCMQLLILL